MGYDYDVQFSKAEEIFEDLGLQEGGPAQTAFDKSFLKHAKKFTPLKTGRTIRSADSASQIGHGVLIWAMPYDQTIYRGDFRFRQRTNDKYGRGGYDSGGLRGRYWAAQTWEIEADEILEDAVKAIGAKKRVR